MKINGPKVPGATVPGSEIRSDKSSKSDKTSGSSFREVIQPAESKTKPSQAGSSSTGAIDSEIGRILEQVKSGQLNRNEVANSLADLIANRKGANLPAPIRNQLKASLMVQISEDPTLKRQLDTIMSASQES